MWWLVSTRPWGDTIEPGAAAEPHRRQLQVVQPLVGDVELVLGLDGGLRDEVVGPESFFGAGNHAERADHDGQRDERNDEPACCHEDTLK